MQTLALIIAGLGAIVLGASAWAWWRHRAKFHEVEQRVASNEASRFALERHAHAVDIRLAALSQALQSLEHHQQVQQAASAQQAEQAKPARPASAALDSVGSVERRHQMHAVLARADASAAAQLATAKRQPRGWADAAVQSGWPETEPMPLNGFADTLPAELDVPERAIQKQRP